MATTGVAGGETKEEEKEGPRTKNGEIVDVHDFSPEEEAEENAAMTESQKKEAEAVLYGQVHPKETPEIITKGLQELEVEVDKLSEEMKVGWMKAKAQCASDLVDDSHKLLFLRCEVFNADLAALRLVKYWNKRIELFGESKAFLPMTQEGALRDDALALSVCHFMLLPKPDSHGRAIVFIDPSKLRPELGYTRTSMTRAIWYIVHAALETSESAQQRGVIFLGYPKTTKLKQVDRKLIAMFASSIKGLLPIRVGGLHVCHPPAFAARVIFPVVKFFIGARLRARFKVQYGTQEKVLAALATYGLTKDRIPTELGGHILVNQEKWLEDRRAQGK